MNIILSFFILILGGSEMARASDRGSVLYKSRCLSCHGEGARGLREKRAPSLRRQRDWYLVSSMEKFIKGEREHPFIVSGSRALSEGDMKELARYLSDLKQ